jgi:VanZ family protein
MTNSPGRDPETNPRPEPALKPPAILGNWLTWLLLAAAFLIPFFLPIAQGLRRHPIIGALGEQVHIPLLAAITLLIYWKGPLRGRLWAAAAAAAVIGGAIEGLQMLVGRSALLADWFLDLIGIGLVVGFVLWRGHGLRPGKWLFIALLILIPAQLWYIPFEIQAKYKALLTFPMLADFDSEYTHWLWKEINNSRLSMVPGGKDRGQVLRLAGAPPSRWPGTRFMGFPHDWRGYTELCLDVRLARADRDTLNLNLRVGDFEGRLDESWLAGKFPVDRQWRTIRLPLTTQKLQRSDRYLDLTDVDGIALYVSTPRDSFALDIDNLFLR